MTTETATKIFKILSLDGGGAKGFYTLGVLEEIEANMGTPIHKCFDLIYGTSTGAIIAAMVARGDSVANVKAAYIKHVPTIMNPGFCTTRTEALSILSREIFNETKVSDFKTLVGIVATNWSDERPFIFKSSTTLTHRARGSAIPFFGCSVADAVIASCSAYPYFETHTIKKSNGDVVKLADGGFCANNPTLYAISDATIALKRPHTDLRVISIGVGAYPKPSPWNWVKRICGCPGLIRHGFNADFLQKVLATNTRSMEVLRDILFEDVLTIRIHDTFVEPEMATDLLEHNLEKLNSLTRKGHDSYLKEDKRIKEYLGN